MATFDPVIRGGTIVDGSGAARFTGDVAVKDGLIAQVGNVTGDAAEEIDASDKIVAPGFVDIHTHYDGQATWDQEMAPRSRASPRKSRWMNRSKRCARRTTMAKYKQNKAPSKSITRLASWASTWLEMPFLARSTVSRARGDRLHVSLDLAARNTRTCVANH